MYVCVCVCVCVYVCVCARPRDGPGSPFILLPVQACRLQTLGAKKYALTHTGASHIHN